MNLYLTLLLKKKTFNKKQENYINKLLTSKQLSISDFLRRVKHPTTAMYETAFSSTDDIYEKTLVIHQLPKENYKELKSQDFIISLVQQDYSSYDLLNFKHLRTEPKEFQARLIRAYESSVYFALKELKNSTPHKTEEIASCSARLNLMSQEIEFANKILSTKTQNLNNDESEPGDN